MEAETTAAPVAEGVPQNGSQGAESFSQENIQSQEATPNQVEIAGQQSQAQEAERIKPSDRYRERNRVRKLEEMMQTQQQQLREMAEFFKGQQQPSAPKVQSPEYLNPEKFFAAPDRALQRFREDVRQEIMEEMGKTIPKKFEEFSTQREMNQKMQEALEVMFPKSSGSNEPLKERIAKNEEKAERLQAILNDEGLNSLPDPVKAAKLAVMLYDAETKLSQQRPTNPNAIKKSLMGAQAAGQPVGGGKKMPTLQEVKAEMDKHAAMAEQNSDLRFDEGWKKRRLELRSQYSDLINQTKGNVTQ